MRYALTVLLAVCCFGAFSHSQTADELIAKNIQARGGMEKMKAIKNFRLTGKFDGGGGFTASIGQENERPNLIRESFLLQGMTAVQAYDGTIRLADPALWREKRSRVDGRRRRARPAAGR